MNRGFLRLNPRFLHIVHQETDDALPGIDEARTRVGIVLRLGNRIEVARQRVFLAGTELKLVHRFPIVGSHFVELDFVAHCAVVSLLCGTNSFRTAASTKSWTQTSARATWRRTSLAGFPHHPV